MSGMPCNGTVDLKQGCHTALLKSYWRELQALEICRWNTVRWSTGTSPSDRIIEDPQYYEHPQRQGSPSNSERSDRVMFDLSSQTARHKRKTLECLWPHRCQPFNARLSTSRRQEGSCWSSRSSPVPRIDALEAPSCWSSSESFLPLSVCWSPSLVWAGA